ncbi:MAG: PilW family protein [Proteobacteria bacterium]|nr:PilW family protein [Pseudomonadota bacterium]
MIIRYDTKNSIRHQAGITLVELMVALTIGSFLMIGAVQIYNQSRHAFVINESIARVQETAQFAMDTIEADLRMASNWGRHSRGAAIDGRSIIGGDLNPLALPAPVTCGAAWALDLGQPLVGSNNAYTLPCAATGGVQPNSDVITTRRATVLPATPKAGYLQIQTTRIQGELFADGNVPSGFNIDPLIGPVSETHSLLVNSYYVAASSELIPGVPTLRRKMLTGGAGGPVIVDQEVAPGVENIQLQLGVDVDQDNTVDRYVNPGDPIFIPGDAAFIAGARVITARIWIVVRGITREAGIVDTVNYQPGDVTLGVFNDSFRRMQISKTILLRNART